MSWNKWARGPQLLSPGAENTEARVPRAPAAQGKPLQWEAGALQLGSSPHLPQLEKAWTQHGNLSAAKGKEIQIYLLKMGAREIPRLGIT